MTNTIIDVAAAIVINNGKFLSAKRLGGYLHNLWEFPGGKLEKYETPKLAAERELEEELGIKAVASETVLVLDYAYPDKSVRLHFVLCSLDNSKSNNLALLAQNPTISWFTPEIAPLNDFCPADKLALEKIKWDTILKNEDIDNDD